jgi:hypothetical protein
MFEIVRIVGNSFSLHPFRSRASRTDFAVMFVYKRVVLRCEFDQLKSSIISAMSAANSGNFSRFSVSVRSTDRRGTKFRIRIRSCPIPLRFGSSRKHFRRPRVCRPVAKSLPRPSRTAFPARESFRSGGRPTPPLHTRFRFEPASMSSYSRLRELKKLETP